MPTYYTNGALYCRKRTCRLLHRGRGRVRPTTATDDLQPCDRHTDESAEPAEPDGSGGMAPRDAAQLIQAGECPWCDDYEGDHVGRHASSAHADEWQRFKNSDVA
jgi:hypothetical protein